MTIRDKQLAPPQYPAGPRALKVYRSREWCLQTLDLLKTRWQQKEFTDEQWQEILDELRSVNAGKVPEWVRL